MLKKTFFCLIIGAVILLTGCTKEDTSMCYSGLKLRYQYILNKHYTNLFGPDVNDMVIYIFDQNGVLMDSISEHGTHLTNDWYKDIDLKPGKYTIVSWGGDLSSYWVAHMNDPVTHNFKKGITIGETKLIDFRMMIQYQEGSITEIETVTEPADLYYGKETNVEVKIGEYRDETIDMIKNTNTLKVFVTGIQHLNQVVSRSTVKTNDQLLDIYCTAYNGRYKYNNMIGEYARSLKYTPPYHITDYDNMKIEAEMKVMRLMYETHEARPTRLIIKDLSGNILYDRDVVNEILKMKDDKGNYLFTSQEDFDREDEYAFEFRIDKDINITVWINGWKVNTIYPGV